MQDIGPIYRGRLDHVILTLLGIPNPTGPLPDLGARKQDRSVQEMMDPCKLLSPISGTLLACSGQKVPKSGTFKVESLWLRLHSCYK